jgi:hypothetical protein
MVGMRGIVRRRSTRYERFARNLPLWIGLAVGALLGATIAARRIFRSADDGPLYTPDQAEPLQTEFQGADLEGAAAAHSG